MGLLPLPAMSLVTEHVAAGELTTFRLTREPGAIEVPDVSNVADTASAEALTMVTGCTADVLTVPAPEGSTHVTASEPGPVVTLAGSRMLLTTVPALSTIAGVETNAAPVCGVSIALHENPAAAKLVTLTALPATAGVVMPTTVTPSVAGFVRVSVCAADLTPVDGLAGSLQVTTSDALPC